jgi:hypothetical protein
MQGIPLSDEIVAMSGLADAQPVTHRRQLGKRQALLACQGICKSFFNQVSSLLGAYLRVICRLG